MKRKFRSFSPPTARQLQRHLDRHAPRPPSRFLAWSPIAMLALMLVLFLTVPHGWVLVLPWLAVIFYFGELTRRVRSVQSLEQRLMRVQELAMMRYWVPSLRLGWRLIPSLATLPHLHYRAVIFMAHCLDRVKAYEPAILAYEYALGQLPSHHPGSVQLQIQCAMTQLADGRLTDADDTLRRLRARTDRDQHPVNRAAYRLACLFQQIRTNHWDDAVQDAQGLLNDLRPLGIESGYGHALMALAYQRVSGRDSNEPDPRAVYWWSRATTLLPPVTLLDRFPELHSMTHYPSAAEPVCYDDKAPPT